MRTSIMSPTDLNGQLASAPSSPSSPSSSSDDLVDSTRQIVSVKLRETDNAGQYLLTAEDAELLREILKHNLSFEKSGSSQKPRFRFRDLEFTRQLSTFDRQNLTFSSSEFRGFFVLFWMGVAMMLLKVVANNWRIHGTIWGKNEIIRLMFAKDVLVLGLTDLVLCWSTVFCLVVQRAVFKGYLRWSGSGWLIQNVCFIVYLQVLLC
jgi:sterol O-acyltransferase